MKILGKFITEVENLGFLNMFFFVKLVETSVVNIARLQR